MLKEGGSQARITFVLQPLGGLGGDLEQGFPADAVRGETSFRKEPCTSCDVGLAAVWESSFRAPQLISSAARICRGCQFRRLLSQTRPAGAWCCGGFACLLCLQGKLKGLGDQQEKELQNPCTEVLQPCLWAATGKLCQPHLVCWWEGNEDPARTKTWPESRPGTEAADIDERGSGEGSGGVQAFLS